MPWLCARAARCGQDELCGCGEGALLPRMLRCACCVVQCTPCMRLRSSLPMLAAQLLPRRHAPSGHVRCCVPCSASSHSCINLSIARPCFVCRPSMISGARRVTALCPSTKWRAAPSPSGVLGVTFASSIRGLQTGQLLCGTCMHIATRQVTLAQPRSGSSHPFLTAIRMLTLPSHPAPTACSNGGVFGSVLSTPIINPPQSAILGMHATNMRPWVVNGQIVPRWVQVWLDEAANPGSRQLAAHSPVAHVPCIVCEVCCSVA